MLRPTSDELTNLQLCFYERGTSVLIEQGTRNRERRSCFGNGESNERMAGGGETHLRAAVVTQERPRICEKR